MTQYRFFSSVLGVSSDYTSLGSSSEDAWICKGYKNGDALVKTKNNHIMNTDFKEYIEAIPEWIGDYVRQTYSHGETGGQR